MICIYSYTKKNIILKVTYTHEFNYIEEIKKSKNSGGEISCDNVQLWSEINQRVVDQKNFSDIIDIIDKMTKGPIVLTALKNYSDTQRLIPCNAV